MDAEKQKALEEAMKQQALAATTTSDEVAAKLHDHMVGKTVVITGVSPTGLGAEAARIVALHSPKLLVLASRTPANIQEVIAKLQKLTDNKVAIEPLQLDLGDQASIRKAAADLIARHPVIDVIINNAGIMMLPTMQTVKAADGTPIERQFGTNHIGHFLFTNLLVPALSKSTFAGAKGGFGARIVNVSSRGFTGSPVVALDDPTKLEDTPANRAAYDSFLAYAQSKTANLLFSVGLARRLASRGILAFGLDPGAIATTNLARDIPLEVRVKFGWFLENGDVNPNVPFISDKQSVSSYVMAAYDPELNDKSGVTITSAAIDNSILDYAKDPVLADKLWALSEKLVGQEFRY